MHSTLGWHQYRKPPFEPRAQYIPAKTMKWGNAKHGYYMIPAARADDPETMQPLDLDAMQPPCDLQHAALLYRTGFLAMLLTEDGKPWLKQNGSAAAEPADEAVPEPTGSTCPKCGRKFKGTHIPHFHTKYCRG